MGVIYRPRLVGTYQVFILPVVVGGSNPHCQWPRVRPGTIQCSFTELGKLEGWVGLAAGGVRKISWYDLHGESKPDRWHRSTIIHPLWYSYKKYTLPLTFSRHLMSHRTPSYMLQGLYVTRDMPLVKHSTFNMLTSFVFYDIVGINRSSHWSCSDWKGFLQTSCSIITLPTESIRRILEKCLRKNSCFSKTADNNTCIIVQNWSLSQALFRNSDEKTQNTYPALSGCFQILTIFYLSAWKFYCNNQIVEFIVEFPFKRKILSQ